jgi:AraC-like DNA-binding protein
MLLWRRPPPPLSAYVRVLWYAEGWAPTNGLERHMPDGTAGLIVLLTPEAPGCSDDLTIVTGPKSTASLLHGGEPRTVMGAQFTTGGAAPFVSLPLRELSNQVVPLRYAGCRDAAVLREQLLAATSGEQRLARLETWLMHALLRHSGPDAAIAWAVRQIERRPGRPVADVASHLGRSTRWFIDRFSSEVGLTPKVFARVQRFHLALRRLYQHPASDLVDLAIDSGYFDQAHFGHEFRSIAGITATEYLAGRTEHLNHVALTKE